MATDGAIKDGDSHNDGVASTRQSHSLNLSMVMYRSHWIPAIGMNYVGGCRISGVCSGSDSNAC